MTKVNILLAWGSLVARLSERLKFQTGRSEVLLAWAKGISLKRVFIWAEYNLRFLTPFSSKNPIFNPPITQNGLETMFMGLRHNNTSEHIILTSLTAQIIKDEHFIIFINLVPKLPIFNLNSWNHIHIYWQLKSKPTLTSNKQISTTNGWISLFLALPLWFLGSSLKSLFLTDTWKCFFLSLLALPILTNQNLSFLLTPP